ncbi:hypothetical protein BH09PSE5_BH09PSE5_50380 [soil metagenome]
MQLTATAGLIPTSAASLGPFRLSQPDSLRDAAALMGRAGTPVVLAGGTDLVACFNEGLAPDQVIDVSGIGALRELALDGSVLRIGAGVTHHAGSTHALVRRTIPGFANAWSRIANPRIRFRATLGGNLMARRTRYEASILLTALQANASFMAADGSVATTPVASIWSDTNDRTQGLLTSIAIETSQLIGFDYERSLRPLMSQAVALFRTADGVQVSFAIATEYLRPLHISLHVPAGQGDTADRAASIARLVMQHVPDTFRDPTVTPAYARQAGAALLKRQLERLDV